IRDLIVTGVQTCALPIFFPGVGRGRRIEREVAVEVLRRLQPDIVRQLASGENAEIIGTEGRGKQQDGERRQSEGRHGKGELGKKDRKSTRLNSSHDQISY